MSTKKTILLAFLAVILFVGFAGIGSVAAFSTPDTAQSIYLRIRRTRTPTPSAQTRVPINDLGTGTYLGFQGGLYPGGVNTMPSKHHTDGLTRAGRVQPLDMNGNPSPNGKMVLLSIGMSNTTQEYCYLAQNPSCNSWTFAGQAAQDPAVNHTSLAIIDGAFSSATADQWVSPSSSQYNRVRDQVLAPRGLSEKQVQVVWLKVADPSPRSHGYPSLPAQNSDAYYLLTNLGNIARAMRDRYVNLQLVFVSSRIYAGYATTNLNPEPYAYESGFAVKWLIQAQITQMDTGQIDPNAGDLEYDRSAPWIAWGPYMWADGTHPRSDGLVWNRSDFETDGTHPSQTGETKVGGMLLSFFKTGDLTQCWFLAGGC